MGVHLWCFVVCVHLVAILADCSFGTKKAVNVFKQLPSCHVDFTFSPDTAVYTVSILECSRLCAQNGQCQGFNYKFLSPHSSYCGIVNRTVTSCSQLSYHPRVRHYQKWAPSLAQPWKLALSQNKETIISGSLSYLMEAIHRGCQIRLTIEKLNGAYTELFMGNTGTVWVVNQSVTAQIYTFSWELVDGKVVPVWTNFRINTSGWVTESVHGLKLVEFQTKITWYLKETLVLCPFPGNVLVEVGPTGEIHRDNINHLLRAIEEGFPLQMVERRNQSVMRSFPVFEASSNGQNFELYGIEVQDILGTNTNGPFTSEMIKFQNMAASRLTSFSNFNILSMSETSLTDSNRNITSITVAADFNWEKLYVIDENGLVKYGSLSELVQRVRRGSDVRVVYRCETSAFARALPVDRLSENGGVLTAYAATSFSYRDGYGFDWLRREIHSDGIVDEVILNRINGSEKRLSCRAQTSWFVDKILRTKISFVKNPTLGTHLNQELFYKGIMPRVVMSVEEGWPVNAFSVHTMTTLASSLVKALNYRCFNGSLLAINDFDSNDMQTQATYDVTLTDALLVGENLARLLHSIEWYA